MNVFFVWSDGSLAQMRDEAGAEQPALGSQGGPADAGGCAERLDSICSSALGAVKLGAGRARPKQRWQMG